MENSRVIKDVYFIDRLVDIRIENGKIAMVADKGPALVGENLWVLPGMIDLHVHDRQPGGDQKEDWRHLGLAAIKGGVTTIGKMPNTSPPIISLEVLRQARALVDPDSPIKPLYWFGVSQDPFNGEEMELAAKEPDVVGFKLFMGSSTGNLLVDDPEVQLKAACFCAQWKKPLAVHPESEALFCQLLKFFGRKPDFVDHGDVRSEAVEIWAIDDGLKLALAAGCQIHFCHVSTLQGLRMIRRAKANGLNVSAEVTPHHLFLNRERLEGPCPGRFKMNPPLRNERTRLSLLADFQNGLFDSVGSDHAPHTKEEKEAPYAGCPSGVPGIETSLPLLADMVLAGSLAWQQLVEYTSANPARIVGLRNKGKIEVGADADLVLVDPRKKTFITNNSIVSKCGWTPFDGWETRGKIAATIVGGQYYEVN